MTIIKIIPETDGFHKNQSPDRKIPLPSGWAIVPESLGTPETLENYPFGEISVANVDGVPTVTGWTPLPIPAAEEPEPGPGASLEDRVEVLEEETAALTAAIERGLRL